MHLPCISFRPSKRFNLNRICHVFVIASYYDLKKFGSSQLSLTSLNDYRLPSDENKQSDRKQIRISIFSTFKRFKSLLASASILRNIACQTSSVMACRNQYTANDISPLGNCLLLTQRFKWCFLLFLNSICNFACNKNKSVLLTYGYVINLFSRALSTCIMLICTTVQTVTRTVAFLVFIFMRFVNINDSIISVCLYLVAKLHLAVLYLFRVCFTLFDICLADTSGAVICTLLKIGQTIYSLHFFCDVTLIECF